MDLRCTENATFLEENDDNEDMGMEGIKSFADKTLLDDQRVLTNVLTRCWNQARIPDYFGTVQTVIKPHMRKIVVGWMLDVTEEQACHPEVFALSVNYLDRVLSIVDIKKGQFQLLASVCIFLASKFKETNPLCAEKLVVYSDFSITAQEITQWELLVLQVLNWDLSAVTPHCIVDQLLRRLPLEQFDRAQARHYTETLVSLAATEHSLQVRSSSSLIAVSCLAASLARMRQTAEQDVYLRGLLNNLCSVTGLHIQEIVDCVNRLEDVISENTPASLQPPPHKMSKLNNTTNSFSCNSSSSNSLAAANSFSGSNFCNNLNTVSSTPTDMVDISATCVY